MPVDPLPQDLDIPNKETALKRLALLQQNILRLRDDIPDMAEMAATIKQELEAIDQNTQRLVFLVDRLLERQKTWQDWLTNRLTLLANLKTYLEMNSRNNLPEEEEESA